MAKWFIVAGLAALNLVLGAGVYQRVMEKSAQAQGIGAPRGGEIASVAGASNGQTVIYMLDVASGKLIAFRLDIANKRITPVTGLNVGEALRRVQ